MSEGVWTMTESEFRFSLARAWDEGHNHCFHVEDPRNPERNPYEDKA